MKRVIAISFALLMLVSSIGLTMSTHLCNGQVVESTFSVGIVHLSCGMADTDKGCSNELSHQSKIQQKPCCANQYQVLQFDDNMDIQSKTGVVNPVFFLAFTLSLLPSLVVLQPNGDRYADYSPPLLNRDVQVLFQSFLI